MANSWLGARRQCMNWLLFLFVWRHFVLYSLLPLWLQSHSSLNTETGSVCSVNTTGHTPILGLCLEHGLPHSIQLFAQKSPPDWGLLCPLYLRVYCVPPHCVLVLPSFFFFPQSTFNLLRYHIVYLIVIFTVFCLSPPSRILAPQRRNHCLFCSPLNPKYNTGTGT